eukprot:gene8176-9611_t
MLNVKTLTTIGTSTHLMRVATSNASIDGFETLLKQKQQYHVDSKDSPMSPGWRATMVNGQQHSAQSTVTTNPSISAKGLDALRDIKAEREAVEKELEKAIADKKLLQHQPRKILSESDEEIGLVLLAEQKQKAIDRQRSIEKARERIYKKQAILEKIYVTRLALPPLPTPSPAVMAAITKDAIKYYTSMRAPDNRGQALLKELRAIFPKDDISLFGSSINGLAFLTSDFDISLLTADRDASPSANNIANMLRKNGYKRVLALPRAKVPIVKFQEKRQRINCDISINDELARQNSMLVGEYCKVDERVAPLIFAVKFWSKQRSINDASMSSLHSYSYVNMVIHYLQRKEIGILPCLQYLADGGIVKTANGQTYGDGKVMTSVMVDGKDVRYYKVDDHLKTFGSQCKLSIGELICGFFKYYARTFNFDDTISVRTGDVIQGLEWKSENYFKIQDPFDTEYNMARSIHTLAHMTLILDELERAHVILSSPQASLKQLTEYRPLTNQTVDKSQNNTPRT